MYLYALRRYSASHVPGKFQISIIENTVQVDMWEQGRYKLVCSSAKSDQSLSFPLNPYKPSVLFVVHRQT